MVVTLVDENVDHWEVTFTYPENNNTTVILRFKFHLTEYIPPKATVVFPTNIQYVCFQELGSVQWSKDCDIMTLMLSLYQEYSTRGAVHEASSTHLTEEVTYFSFPDSHPTRKLRNSGST
jgi:hypothetical protein